VEFLTAGQPSRIIHDAALDLLVQSLHVLVVKRDFTAHQNIDDDAKTPHIHLGARVSFGSEKLGCGEIETPTESLEVTAGGKQVAEPKVDDLDVAILADEDIFNLEVAVDDAIPMAVVEGAGDLAGEFAGLFLLEFAVGDDVVEHLTSVDKLEEHVPVIVGPNDISQAADMRMVQESHDGSLARGADLLGMIGPLLISKALMAVVGRAAWDNLAGDL
jgi:hypothetical protein